MASVSTLTTSKLVFAPLASMLDRCSSSSPASLVVNRSNPSYQTSDNCPAWCSHYPTTSVPQTQTSARCFDCLKTLTATRASHKTMAPPTTATPSQQEAEAATAADRVRALTSAR